MILSGWHLSDAKLLASQTAYHQVLHLAMAPCAKVRVVGPWVQVVPGARLAGRGGRLGAGLGWLNGVQFRRFRWGCVVPAFPFTSCRFHSLQCHFQVTHILNPHCAISALSENGVSLSDLMRFLRFLRTRIFYFLAGPTTGFDGLNANKTPAQ